MNQSNHPAPGANGPWRLAVIDRGDDPKLMIATIVLAEDVTAAPLIEGHFYIWRAVLDFATARVGEAVELTPLTNPVAWSIRPQRKPAD